VSVREVVVAQARADVAAATLRLAEVLRENCPGRHRYVQHRDARPPWCPECGYGQDGVRYRD
jgi:hypothetical protein